MELSLIWAQGPNREIGVGNQLPWRLPEDLAHFKATTMGCPVIMGRRTFESLPNGGLPGRLNIVLTRSGGDFAGAVTALDLQQAIALAASTRPVQAFIIGGAQVYQSALAVADSLYITHVDVSVPAADAFAPEVPARYQLTRVDDWATSRTGLRYRFERWSARRG